MRFLLVLLISASFNFSGNSAEAQEWSTEEAKRAFGTSDDTVNPALLKSGKPYSLKNKNVKMKSVIKKNDQNTSSKLTQPYVYTDQNLPSDSSNVVSDSSSSSNIIIEFYVQDSYCHGCIEAEEYLKSRGYRYIKYNNDSSPENRARFKEKGGVALPFFVIGTHTTTGYAASLEHEIDNLMNYTPSRKEKAETEKRQKSAKQRE